MMRHNLNTIKQEFPNSQMMLLWINHLGSSIATVGEDVEKTSKAILEDAIELVRQSVPKNSDIDRIEFVLARLAKGGECDEEKHLRTLTSEGIPSACLQMLLHARALRSIACNWENMNMGIRTLRTLQSKQLLPKVAALDEANELDSAYEYLQQALLDAGYAEDQAKKCTQRCKEMTNALCKMM